MIPPRIPAHSGPARPVRLSPGSLPEKDGEDRADDASDDRQLRRGAEWSEIAGGGAEGLRLGKRGELGRRSGWTTQTGGDLGDSWRAERLAGGAVALRSVMRRSGMQHREGQERQEDRGAPPGQARPKRRLHLYVLIQRGRDRTVRSGDCQRGAIGMTKGAPVTGSRSIRASV